MSEVTPKEQKVLEGIRRSKALPTWPIWAAGSFVVIGSALPGIFDISQGDWDSGLLKIMLAGLVLGTAGLKVQVLQLQQLIRKLLPENPLTTEPRAEMDKSSL